MSPDSKNIGLSDPELDLSVRRRRLRLINKLHSIGVQIDIDLPQIAVIGNQGAGKSSLIESISGITSPRAAGACTRCPTEYHLTRSKKPWQCIVSLHFIADEKGQPLGQARDEKFGPIITEKSEVEDRIRRAQRAILNPSRPWQTFLQGEDNAAESELSFSTNCVSLQISAPKIAGLSFCDLPGLIKSGGNMSDMVESLVTSYIKKPSCIILLTVACETDFENRRARRLAREHDPEGMRTIGVLTKPDYIPQGEEGSWISLIMNERAPLANNWYCVKQPSSDEIQKGITCEEARKRERKFFSMSTPWRELEGTYQKFLRTPNLVERLSAVLSKRLPEIQDKLINAVEKTKSQLKELPLEPSGDPPGDILKVIYKFTIDIVRHTDGISAHDELLQAIRPAQYRFRNAIRRTAPDFVPFDKDSDKQFTAPKFLAQADSDEDGSENSDRPEGRGGKYYLDEVMKKVQETKTLNPIRRLLIVMAEYAGPSIEYWHEPALDFCKSVYEMMDEHLRTLVRDHFSFYGQGLLEQRVRVLMQDNLKKCWERTRKSIKRLLDLKVPLDARSVTNYRAEFFTYYMASRAKDRYPDRHDVALLYQALRAGLNPTIIAKMNIYVEAVEAGDLVLKPLPLDPMEPAINIMADVQAHFQVLRTEFMDNVSNAIGAELIRGIKKDLWRELYVGLGLHEKGGGRHIYQELEKEHPAVVHKRQELKRRLEALETATREFRELLSV